MSERIGGVLINDEDYPGRDLYSDGSVEDILLEIAQNRRPEDFDRIVAERKSWPVMYHFSTIRQNILSWYPFSGTERVLEIGSGCGAVTRTVASRVRNVTCVDLSKKRSLVNAWRNRDLDNIEIRLGNFRDVEKKLGTDYDVITLIGVFEYAAGYISTEQPYEDFLRIIGRHLAPGGKILIAIENRLGMKYFAGCTEDHTGRFFDGIEGYPGGGAARTFSKSGLERIFDAAGFGWRQFRYPYPDYKFPMSIYSDRYLPKRGELRNNMVNYDRKRLVVFDEGLAYDALETKSEFPVFSNSFFVTLSAEPFETKTADFVKFSNDRRAEFRIRTEIFAGEKPFARKRAASEEASAHVASLPEMTGLLEQAFRGTRLHPGPCRTGADGSAEYDFLPGRTLEEEADLLIRKPEELKELFRLYFSEIDRTAQALHEDTDEYLAVFGGGLPARERKAPAVSDVDLVLSNIIVRGEDWYVIDTEWTFPFTVPADFIKWRAVHYYIGGGERRGSVDAGALTDLAGIDRRDIPYFEEMERRFQEYIAGDAVPLWKLYPEVSEGAVPVADAAGGRAVTGGQTNAVTIYFDRGEGFSEGDSEKKQLPEDGKLFLEIETCGVRNVRIDPTELPCFVSLDGIFTDGKPVDSGSVETNGYTADGSRFLFTTEDPQILIRGIPEGTGRFTANLQVRCGAEGIRSGAEQVLDAKNVRIRYLSDRLSSEEETVKAVVRAADALKENRAVRAYRTVREKLKKGDPFDSIRPALVNHREAHLTLDRRCYQPEGIHLMGWFYDPAYPGESLRVTDARGRELPLKCDRFPREDVAAALGITDGRCTGFNILIGYDISGAELPLRLRAENPRGVMDLALDIEPDRKKRLERRKLFRQGQNEGYLLPVTDEYDDWDLDRRIAEEETDRASSDRTGNAADALPGGETSAEEGPLISVIIPLYRTRREHLAELLLSLTGQTRRKIEICFADGSPDDSLEELIREISGGDERVKYRHLPENLGISGNTNAACAMASGDVLMLCDHDDILEPDACELIAKAFAADERTDAVYTDEDKVTAEGRYLYDPNFKPDFDPDYLLSSNYICHIFAVKTAVAKEAGLLREEYDGAQDHDFILRCTEKARKTAHIPKALYHWRAHPDSTAGRPESKMYAYENGRRAVEAHLERLGIRGETTHTDHLGHFRTKYAVDGEPLVSILIPNRDQADVLSACVRSILRKSTWRNYEILIIENGSREEKTFRTYEQLRAEDGRVRVSVWDRPFNYSAVNNFGAAEARGEYLLFLNNDTEVVTEDWIEELLGFCQREDTGCVGAYLEYPDGTIQHTGVIVGMGGAASHMFGGMDVREYPGGGRCFSQQDLSAVTGACMMTKRRVFEEAGGFDEELAIAYNDVDYCLKVRKMGLLVAVNVYAKLIHYESLSRGSDEESADRERHARLLGEAELLRRKWPEYFTDGDPYYNPNLTLSRPDFSLGAPMDAARRGAYAR